MRLLPHSLWLFIAAHLEAAQAQQQQQASGYHHHQQQLPTAIKKMSPDQNEKFHPHYVAFADSSSSSSPNSGDPNRPLPLRMNSISAEEQQAPEVNPSVLAARRLADEQDALFLRANSSAPISYRPPFANHNHRSQQQRLEEEERAWSLFRRSREALARLQHRQWNCPEGTVSCARIGYPNSCCRTSETCVEIEDVGLGKVGCCPAGATCGGSVSTCADGNMGCASEIGGGCCLPGFVCAGVGCIEAGTSSTSTLEATTTSDITAVLPPVRPTSSLSIATTTTTTTTTTITSPSPTTSSTSLDYCPTGFYPCLASAGGGCCQTGRDCSVTNCPPIELSTIINTNGQTIAVPITAVPTTTSATGTCASGWYMCGKEAGPLPGCCPRGYACGSVSCSVVITPTSGELATATEAKELPTHTKPPAAPLVDGAAREVVGVEVIVGVAVVVGGMML
ncbi:hypothetical protein GE21DRAFT_7838 [Neurospora crassa]|uniref:GPI anchored protein n=2 Tax=Neurospora crassa TaxID=5141 RepID=Q7S732_NEUCR|nr:GPI anchored protein [Neurospora crassa OR74A]EAA31347.1 GPI anchored protein [Neurospora crassa OR74A]KHE79217.1 hypothetical protein GE21DRAFT_7838 [Neurospora crassa]CAE76130.1 hypothetical protein [Neurospora crassa]|eukprot:XP_960583.1 GPI anchored protein [Neurospora crassa OR74A]